MAHPILMPKPGQMTEECVLTVWHKAEGEPVAKGDVLFEIETDKSIMDVESFEQGILLRRLVDEGATVPVNTVCGWVGEPGEAVPDAPPPPVATVAGPDATPRVETRPAQATSIDARATSSSGSPGPMAATKPGPAARPAQGERLRISPRATRMAAEAGLDPRSITGSGPGGRIVERDVVAAIGTGAGAPPPSPEAFPTVAGEEPPRLLSRMRRVIAERLTLSATTIPSFTVTVAVDVNRLQTIRADLKSRGTSLSVTDFVLLATAQALADHPDVNSRTDGTQVWPRRRVHLGVAVALPAGLVVPVIRDADVLTLTEIHDRAVELIERARDGTLSPDEMSGSTFTVSNLGMHGVEEFSAIINPGESGILAVSSAVPSAVVVGDGVAVRSIMKLTLTADHRLVDGELGARFLNAVRSRLEDPGTLRRVTDGA
jgi:pyruvate dehydrogenase E2 component (dihydrolipoamide acetyltransferase)